jgi:hypothetical protein
MYNSDTELLFPSRVIPELRDLRGKTWRKLIDRIVGQNPSELDHLAFILMMTRLDGCTTCNSDSFRAMRGCTQCALQNVRRFRGSDKELVEMFEQARIDLESVISKESK